MGSCARHQPRGPPSARHPTAAAFVPGPAPCARGREKKRLAQGAEEGEGRGGNHALGNISGGAVGREHRKVGSRRPDVQKAHQRAGSSAARRGDGAAGPLGGYVQGRGHCTSPAGTTPPSPAPELPRWLTARSSGRGRRASRSLVRAAALLPRALLAISPWMWTREAAPCTLMRASPRAWAYGKRARAWQIRREGGGGWEIWGRGARGPGAPHGRGRSLHPPGEPTTLLSTQSGRGM